ncbi:riboflavin synthase [uncultured Psychrobacter sp.]|uniref:riboflavin synthase n=1 Tax=uncultured Psychrobacter sp. TaxID=259303 RepID=UPI002609051B|nr:riboflavin synthase [uncultured Psychrobacter sp.]
MFTGIIESVGHVKSIQPVGGDIRLTIESDDLDFSDVKLGDSIASNGICLTVVAMGSNYYSVDVSRETIARTALESLKPGHIVNLEKAMLPTTRFGGHIVAGHVDGVGVISKVEKDARSIYIEIEIPKELAHYTATKGSITVDGISLTTNLVRDNIVSLNIIPHTAQVTNIGKHWLLGDKVNIEVDIVARYLERLINKDNRSANTISNPQTDITEAFLADNGFMK